MSTLYCRLIVISGNNLIPKCQLSDTLMTLNLHPVIQRHSSTKRS